MDPIANMLIQIKNAGYAGLDSVSIPYSEIKFTIAKILEKEGYISNIQKTGKKIKKFIECDIVYNDKKPRVTQVERVSKPSKRVYYGVKSIKPVRNGHGRIIVSTPKGVMTGEQAHKEHVGGEVLFKIW